MRAPGAVLPAVMFALLAAVIMETRSVAAQSLPPGFVFTPDAPGVPSKPYFPARPRQAPPPRSPPSPPRAPLLPPRPPAQAFPPVAPDNDIAAALLEVALQLWDPFGHLESWGRTPDPCDGWKGVICRLPGVVTQLDLGVDFDLRGALPDALSGVTTLETLYLNINELEGELPASWSTLSSLSVLFLRGNMIYGSLPEEWSAMMSMKSLALGQNKLRGSIPDSWSQSMTQLKFLDLSGNSGLCGPLPAALKKVADITSTRVGLDCYENGLPVDAPYGPNAPGYDIYGYWNPDPPPSPPPFPPPSPPGDSNWIEDNLVAFILIIVLGVLFLLLLLIGLWAWRQHRKSKESDRAIAEANENAGKAMRAAMEAQLANTQLQHQLMQQQQLIQYQDAQLRGEEPEGPPPVIGPDGRPPPGTAGTEADQVVVPVPERPRMAEGDYVANTHMQYFGSRRLVDHAAIQLTPSTTTANNNGNGNGRWSMFNNSANNNA